MVKLLWKENDKLWKEMEFFNAPLLWNAEEQQQLVGTQIYMNINRTLSGLKENYAKNIVPLIGEDFNRLSFERWKYAYALVRSMEFITNEGISCLIPHISLFCYAKKGNAHLNEDAEGAIEIVMNDEVKIGDEIFLNEDFAANEVGNSKLFDLYGMIIPKRKPVEFKLSVGLSDDDQMYGNKRDLFKQYFKNNYPVQEFLISQNKENGPIPKDLLFALRIFHAKTADYHDLDNAANGRAINSGNERMVWEHLASFIYEQLEKYPTTISEDKALLKDNSLSQNKRNAIIYRKMEHKLLLQAFKFVGAQAEILLKQYDWREYDDVKLTPNR